MDAGSEDVKKKENKGVFIVFSCHGCKNSQGNECIMIVMQLKYQISFKPSLRSLEERSPKSFSLMPVMGKTA